MPALTMHSLSERQGKWEVDENDPQDSKPRLGGFQLAPISLEDFKRQRNKKVARQKEAAAAAKERHVKAMREAARRDGVDMEAIDKMHQALHAEGVDTSDIHALEAALRRKGIDPNNRDEVASYAQELAAASYSTSWGSAVSSTTMELPKSAQMNDMEDISTDNMYSVSSWTSNK